MIKAALLIFFTSLVFIATSQKTDLYSSFKSSIGKIGLVKVLPTFSKTVKKMFRKIHLYSQESIINNIGDKYFNEELITTPIIVDWTARDNFINLIYSDSSDFEETLCYAPRHGIILWDINGNYLGFVEICFECYNIRTTRGIPIVMSMPHQMFAQLENLFKSYGLVEEIRTKNS